MTEDMKNDRRITDINVHLLKARIIKKIRKEKQINKKSAGIFLSLPKPLHC
jgi:hypothetical protein